MLKSVRAILLQAEFGEQKYPDIKKAPKEPLKFTNENNY